MPLHSDRLSYRYRDCFASATLDIPRTVTTSIDSIAVMPPKAFKGEYIETVRKSANPQTHNNAAN